MQDMKTREDGDDLYLEGYFVVYNSPYELWPGATESVAPGAFSESLSGDVRALFNHNQDIVLGRTTNGTLELSDDARGLYGRVKINRNDTDALNAYQRIARGDVTGCSFGFDVEQQTEEFRDDGTIHWTLEKISPLYEVSPCTFPAYEATNISARKRDFEDAKRRRADAWKKRTMERLRKAAGKETKDA
uniref:Prohead serine protease n=1 Tax=Myoviridae sp. ctZNX6 TaxID=2825127 RepID=A0A8S5PBK4_9CAUD|nr:MAG TPA: prohead serine protease [Myoviridae sp. ctZNX6]